PGQHTVQVEALWSQGGFITYGNWSNMQIVEQATAGPGETGITTTLVQTAQQGQQSAHPEPANTWVPIPGLTQTVTITTAQWVNVTADAEIYPTIGQGFNTRLRINGGANGQTVNYSLGEAQMFVQQNTWDTLNSNETFLLTPGTYTISVEGQFSAGGTITYDGWSKLRVTRYHDLPNA